MFPKIGPFQGTSWNEIYEELALTQMKEMVQKSKLHIKNNVGGSNKISNEINS